MTKGLLVAVAFCAATSSFTMPRLTQADGAWKLAQAQPPIQPPPPAAAPSPPGLTQPAQESPDIKKFGDELEKFAEERRKRLDELGATIRGRLKTEEDAKEFFGSYVGAVKDIIERIGPQSDFRKDMDSLLDRTRKNAEEFARSTDPQVRALAGRMTETIPQIEKIITDANTEYARGLGTIRDLDSGRELAIALIKSKAIAQAIAAAEQYLGIVRSIIDDAEKFGKRTRETAPAF